MANIMNAKDAVSASLAECYVTIEGNRYNLMQAIKLEAKVEKTKSEVPILGKTGKGNKATGWKGMPDNGISEDEDLMMREVIQGDADLCYLHHYLSEVFRKGDNF